MAVSHPLSRGCRFAFVQARLRHVFCLVLGLSSSPLGVPKVPLRPLAKVRFLLRLISDLGGVWLFRTFFQARLRHVFCLRTGALLFSFRGSNGATSAPCEGPFFASPELGFRWCLAVSHPLSRGCRFAFVQAIGCVTFFVYVLGLSSSPLGVPTVPLRPLAKGRFLLRLSSDLGGVWLFRIHCPEAAVLPLSRLGCVTFFVYVLGLSSFPVGVPKVPLRPLANDRFLLRLSSDLGGVWLFRIHCPEAAVLPLSRLGCVTFFVYVLGLSSVPLGVPKVPLRPLANDRFLLRLSSDLGGVWLFRIHCPEAAVLPLSRLGCVTFFV